jgi:hypothetical protein
MVTYLVTIVTKCVNRWMSEKFDGVRLFWDGSAFYSRQGKIIEVPDFVKSQMPKIALDGELWYLQKFVHNLICKGHDMDCIKMQSLFVIVTPVKKSGNQLFFGYLMLLI